MTSSSPVEGAIDRSMRSCFSFCRDTAEAVCLFRGTPEQVVWTGTRQHLPIDNPANFAGLTRVTVQRR
jgi:hypothetical protein